MVDIKKNNFYPWYMYFFMLLLIIFSYFFIIAMTYALHPTEIRIFANDEMVATSKNLVVMQRDLSYNECIKSCGDFDTDKYAECFFACEIHYRFENETMGCDVAYDKCFKTITEISKNINQK